jgi:hypothetical protein
MLLVMVGLVLDVGDDGILNRELFKLKDVVSDTTEGIGRLGSKG